MELVKTISNIQVMSWCPNVGMDKSKCSTPKHHDARSHIGNNMNVKT